MKKPIVDVIDRKNGVQNNISGIFGQCDEADAVQYLLRLLQCSPTKWKPSDM